jgi:DNA-binding transcriptional LysR family regulator
MNTTHIYHKMMKGMHMNFSQLQSLVALADTGSFTEAAYTVSLTQSAVSHALAALEGELGVSLFERSRKGVVALTGVGQSILPHVRAILAQAEAIEQEAKSASGVATGKLRLGTTISLCPNLLAGVLTRFEQQYPDIEVVLFEGTMAEVGEWIASSIVDVGFILLPATGMDSTLITTDELCVLVASKHRLHTQTAAHPGDLRGEDFIMPRTQCSYALMEMAGLDPGKIRPPIRYHASDSATILAMVREGLGITLMPRMMLPTKLEGVVALSLDPAQPLPIGLAVRSQSMVSPSARLFIDTASTWPQGIASVPAPTYCATA